MAGKWKAFQVRLSPSDYTLLEQLAAKLRHSKAGLVRVLLRDYHKMMVQKNEENEG